MTDPVLLTAFRRGRPEHTPEAEDVLLHVQDGEATLVADDGETFTFSLRELLREGLKGVPLSELERVENEWSAYAVTLNRRIDHLTALARRRGIDDAAINRVLGDAA